MGDLDKRNLRVLDFGGGYGMLKKLLPDIEVINYDIIKDLSDVDDWKAVSFDVVVANQVYTCLMKMRFYNLLMISAI